MSLFVKWAKYIIEDVNVTNLHRNVTSHIRTYGESTRCPVNAGFFHHKRVFFLSLSGRCTHTLYRVNPPGGKDCVTKYDLQMKPNRYLTVTVAFFSACFFPCPGDADRQSTSNPSGRCGDQFMLCFARANSAEFEGLFYSGMTSIALTDGWFGSQQE
jgi:hypothetical protein